MLWQKNWIQHLKLRLFRENFDSSIPPKNVSKYPKLAFENSWFDILKKSKNALLEHIECSNQKPQMVSYIFLDSEQRLT